MATSLDIKRNLSTFNDTMTLFIWLPALLPFPKLGKMILLKILFYPLCE